MKKLILVPISFILVAIWNVYGNPASPDAVAAAETASAAAYISPTSGKIPIIAFDPYNTTRTPTRQMFDTLISCGFNSAIFSDSIEKLYPLMSRINNRDISLIIGLQWFVDNEDVDLCENVVEEIQERMARLRINSERLGGYFVYDEPRVRNMSDIHSFYSAISQADPSHMPIVNLVGEPASDFMQPQRAHRVFSNDSTKRNLLKSYLNMFCNMYSPAVLSYDFYPFELIDANTLNIYYSDFYYDLALFAHTSKARNIPFWAFCESMNVIYRGPDETRIYPQRPLPTEEYLRFEAFNALALGAQGIAYWAYACHPSNSLNEYYNSALIDSLGNKTTAWYAAQTVNREIAMYDTVFLGATLEAYQFVGDQYVRPTEVCSIPARIDRILHIRRRSGKGALVSKLSNNGRKYIIVVNQDPLNSSTIEFTYRYYGSVTHQIDTIHHPIRPIQPNLPSLQADSAWFTNSQQVTLRPSQYIIRRVYD